MRALARILTVCCGFLFPMAIAHAQLPPPKLDADAIFDIFELLLEKHVSPVTTQQLAQDVLVDAYGKAGRPIPPDLVSRISKTDPDELRQLFVQEFKRINPSPLQLFGLGRHGVFVSAWEQRRVDKQLAANRYVGIGIQLTMEDKYPKINKVFPGGPAAKSGARDGDLILEVDGQETKGETLVEVIQWLRGAKGSEVEVLLDDDGDQRTYVMTRGVVPITTTFHNASSQSGKTAGISLQRITASTVHELKQIDRVLDDTVERVVLDFRQVGGADDLHYGELLANALLDGGSMGFLTTRSGTRDLTAETGRIFADREIILLVDKTTVGVLHWISSIYRTRQQGAVFGNVSVGRALVRDDFPTPTQKWVVRLPVGSLQMEKESPLLQVQTSIAEAPPQPKETHNQLQTESIPEDLDLSAVLDLIEARVGQSAITQAEATGAE